MAPSPGSSLKETIENMSMAELLTPYCGRAEAERVARDLGHGSTGGGASGASSTLADQERAARERDKHAVDWSRIDLQLWARE